MRVGLIIYGDLNTLSGGYLYDRKLVAHLRARGDTVDIVSLPWRNYGRHLLDNISRKFHRTLADTTVDVWLEDELNHPSLLVRPQKKNSHYTPIISIVHHLRGDEARPRWQNSFYRQVERSYLRGADAFIFNSHTTQQSVARELSKQPRGIVAYPGRDRLPADTSDAEIIRRTMKSHPLRIAFLGNIIPRKGVHTLLEAIATLPSNCVFLQLIGRTDADTPYFHRLQKLVSRRQLTDRVQFFGRLSDSELVPQLRKSHILVVPSTYEGFGIVYLEAMGFGVPVIAGKRGGASEIVIHGKTGFLVDSEQPKLLANQLRHLCENRQLLQSLSLEAYARYQQFPTWDKSMTQIRNFLLTLTEAQ